jgi:hypothetical protein
MKQRLKAREKGRYQNRALPMYSIEACCDVDRPLICVRDFGYAHLRWKTDSTCLRHKPDHKMGLSI